MDELFIVYKKMKGLSIQHQSCITVMVDHLFHINGGAFMHNSEGNMITHTLSRVTGKIDQDIYGFMYL